MKIREANGDDVRQIAKVHVDTWRSTYKSILPKEYIASKNYREQEIKWNKRLFNNDNTSEFMFVAENCDGKIVGFASADTKIGEDTKVNGRDFDSILYTLYVDGSYQQKGMGAMLVKTIISALKKLGAENMILWAFKDNKACGFYEHLGGKICDEKVVSVDGIDIVEVAYLWDNLNEG
ncbi:MAG: GNAT family N-acetyltransferase [Clostridium sp.]|uniref:GNAT family N-acetyltransferase n=1 Tax=Clostridium sp. TaxID=1506 RepID=UPI00302137A3